jgi:hypothetical protein
LVQGWPTEACDLSAVGTFFRIGICETSSLRILCSGLPSKFEHNFPHLLRGSVIQMQ